MTPLQHIIHEEFADLLVQHGLKVVAPADWSAFLVSEKTLVELWAYFGEGLGSSYLQLDRHGAWVYPLGMILAERMRLAHATGTMPDAPIGPAPGTGWSARVRLGIRNLAHLSRHVGRDLFEGRTTWTQEVRTLGIQPSRASNALLADICETRRAVGLSIPKFAKQPDPRELHPPVPRTRIA